MSLLIDWEKVYEASKTAKTKEEFLNLTSSLTRIEESSTVQKFNAVLEKYRERILPSLLQSSQMKLSPEKFVQIVSSQVKKNEKLLEAYRENPASMFASILFFAEIGLVPSDETGEAYLIPRNIKQSNGKYLKTITPLIGYKGLVKVIMREEEYAKIEAHAVYKGDKFKVALGTSPKLEHTPKWDADRSADNLTHTYAVVHFKNGMTQFAVMTRNEIMAVRDKAKEPNSLYFNDKGNPNRWMEKKCALVQLAKTLDKDFYGSKFIGMDAAIEGGSFLTLENDKIKLIEGAAVPPARFRDVYGTLNKLPNV
jgi:phage RecT family recombinase